MKTNKVNTDVMVLGATHALMVSNVPKVVIDDHSLSKNFFSATNNFSDKGNIKSSIEKYGLFGGSLNVNSFMPGVTPDMLKPKDEDFIEPMFRLLSATIVAKKYNPTEFPEQVLKESMPLLIGQSVNCDHDTDIVNAIGSVSSVEWQDSYQDESGVVIPAGINGVLKIDGLSNPRIARGIMMDPPSIHSNSVTVEFSWEPSHTFEDMWEFYNKLGTYTEDGELVRRIATKIISYKETSLVWHGADPFAQLLKSGKLNNPSYAGSQYYSFSEDKQALANDPAKRVSMYDFKESLEKGLKYNTGSFNNEGDSSINHNKNSKTNHMNELQQLLDSLFGKGLLTLGEGKEASKEEVISQIQNLVQQNQDLSASKSTLESDIAKLKEDKLSLEKELSKFKAGNESWENYVRSFREETIVSYRKLTGEDRVDENILKLLESDNTSFETLSALRKTYDTQLEDKFPLKCSECGSSNVSRASSVSEGDDTNKYSDRKDVASVAANIADSKLRNIK